MATRSGHDRIRAHLGRAGFETGSDVYERARPTYPDEAVDRLAATAGLTGDSRVLDLAAGTGKLTRQLQARGLRCVAVEPSPPCARSSPGWCPGCRWSGQPPRRIPLGGGDGGRRGRRPRPSTGSTRRGPCPRSSGSSDQAGGWRSSGTSATSPTRWWPSWCGICQVGCLGRPTRWAWTSESVIDRSGRFGPVRADQVPLRPGTGPGRLRRAGGLPELRPGAARIGTGGPCSTRWRRSAPRSPSPSPCRTSPTCSVPACPGDRAAPSRAHPVAGAPWHPVCQAGRRGREPLVGHRPCADVRRPHVQGRTTPMIKLTCLLKRREGMTPAEFQDYWKNNHGPAHRLQPVRQPRDPLRAEPPGPRLTTGATTTGRDTTGSPCSGSPRWTSTTPT